MLAFIYRPPNENTISDKTWSNYMEDTINSANVEDKNIFLLYIIILGDFNIDVWVNTHIHCLNFLRIIPESLRPNNHYFTINLSPWI